MYTVFRDMVNQFVVIYIDGILKYSPCFSQHVDHVCQVLQRLRAYHPFAKGEKCELHQIQVKFLDYIIQPGAVTMDKQKVSAIHEWLRPRTIKELQRFLGFANFYRHFIKNFSQVAAPLTYLT